MGRIFGDRHRGIGARRRLIDIGQGNRKRLVVGQPARIGHPHRHGMARRRFIIEQTAVGHGDCAGAAVDRKPAARRIGEAVGLGVTRIGIGPADRPHHRPVRRVLGHRIRRKHQIRWGIVDRADRHGSVVVRAGAAVSIGEHIADGTSAGCGSGRIRIFIGDVLDQRRDRRRIGTAIQGDDEVAAVTTPGEGPDGHAAVGDARPAHADLSGARPLIPNTQHIFAAVSTGWN